MPQGDVSDAMPVTTYRYLGDRWTAPKLKGARCTAVRRQDGKCIRGRNGSMLVQFENGDRHVVVGRLLRKETR
jgi:hypothetical protein